MGVSTEKLSSVRSRDVLKLENVDSYPVLESLDRAAREKMHKRIARDNGLTDTGEFSALVTERQELYHSYCAMTRETYKNFECKPRDEEQMAYYKRNIGVTIEALRDLHRRLDENEETFLKYDVPRFRGFGSLEAYGKALRAFMRVWREEAERGRERGEKSLIDWLQQLDQPDDEGKRETLEEMRDVAVDLGIHISYKLGSYFMLTAVFANTWEELKGKVQEVKTVLRSLRIENNSVVIERFLVAVKYMRKALKGLSSAYCEEESGEDVAKRRELMASSTLHLIVREVLRFEVAFCCPDLPMMLVDEVFLGMANHMRKVFEKKLDKVDSVINELEIELKETILAQGQERYTVTTQVLELGMRMIWSELELKPVAESN